MPFVLCPQIQQSGWPVLLSSYTLHVSGECCVHMILIRLLIGKLDRISSLDYFSTVFCRLQAVSPSAQATMSHFWHVRIDFCRALYLHFYVHYFWFNIACYVVVSMPTNPIWFGNPTVAMVTSLLLVQDANLIFTITFQCATKHSLYYIISFSSFYWHHHHCTVQHYDCSTVPLYSTTTVQHYDSTVQYSTALRECCTAIALYSCSVVQ